jgi:Spirocyclase AveC-like
MTIEAKARLAEPAPGHQSSLPTEAPEPAARPARQARPALWWAGLGAAAVAMQLYVYLGWITSSDFAPTPTGTDPVPHAVMVKAWILQGAFAAGALAVICALILGCLRARRLTFTAQMWIAWVSIIWLDPWANLIRPQMMFNSYYFNRGSWAGHIPWWISPNAHLLPQPFLIETANYMTMVVMSILGAKLMSYLKRRRPQAGLAGILLPTWIVMGVFVFAIEELVVVRGGWLWWSSNIDALTFWAGTANAMPVTEMALWAITITALAYQIYAHNTFGRAPVERGLDRVRVRESARTALSTFALIGCATVAMLVYSVASAILGLYTGNTPANIPTYFTNGICNSVGAPPCPTQGGPVYRQAPLP